MTSIETMTHLWDTSIKTSWPLNRNAYLWFFRNSKTCRLPHVSHEIFPHPRSYFQMRRNTHIDLKNPEVPTCLDSNEYHPYRWRISSHWTTIAFVCVKFNNRYILSIRYRLWNRHLLYLPILPLRPSFRQLKKSVGQLLLSTEPLYGCY